ncbi:MAG TPA: hypothetical protein VD861_16620 [Pyrinomonadaceae bacterium]|nr:hypothetical protein [Pyrinomonadaceae bacterium]
MSLVAYRDPSKKPAHLPPLPRTPPPSTRRKMALWLRPDNPAASSGVSIAGWPAQSRHQAAVGPAGLLTTQTSCVSIMVSVLVYGQAGRRKEAQRALGQLKDLSRRTYVSPLWMATAHAGLGEKDQAFKYFEQAFAERASGAAVSLKVNAIFDGLRSDPRFDDLLRRAGFKT